MKAILMSIKPKWCEKIFSGEKTIEVRKTAPKETPFKVYVYCSNGDKLRLVHSLNTDGVSCMVENDEFVLNDILNGKVIGEFVCDGVIELPCETTQPYWLKEKTCLSDGEYMNYLGHKNGKGLYIIEAKLFDEPRELSDFKTPDKPYHEIIERNGSLMFMDGYESGKPLKRAPQSWMYVGEVVK